MAIASGGGILCKLFSGKALEGGINQDFRVILETNDTKDMKDKNIRRHSDAWNQKPFNRPKE